MHLSVYLILDHEEKKSYLLSAFKYRCLFFSVFCINRNPELFLSCNIIPKKNFLFGNKLLEIIIFFHIYQIIVNFFCP